MSDYFNPSDACPKSKELLFHSTVTTVRCGRCTLLNPNYIESPDKPLVGLARPPIEKEIIEIESSPTQPTPTSPLQGLPPAQRRGLATQIPILPTFKLGYAEKERQLVDQRLTERKTKTAFIPSIPTVHFSVGVAHWAYDDLGDDEGYWTSASNQWSVDEDNRELTSDTLVASLLHQASNQCKRANLKKWLHCDGGDWSLGHTNPAKMPARDIAPWDQARLLSTVIDSGAYEQKVIPGTARKLVFVWLYWTPEPPPGPAPTPTPSKAGKKGAKKAIKKEQGIKAEKEVKAEPESTSKRRRAISGEVSTTKRPNTTTRKQAKVREEGHAEEDLQGMLQGVEGVEGFGGGAGDD
jgi:hypothetical protein